MRILTRKAASVAAPRVARMQGDPEIIDLLNDVLTAELTAINQYFIHAKMCENWGYHRLAAHGRDESIDEMKHADDLSSGSSTSTACRTCSGCSRSASARPSPSSCSSTSSSSTPRSSASTAASPLAVAKGDNGTRELLAGILVSEEDTSTGSRRSRRRSARSASSSYLAQQLHD